MCRNSYTDNDLWNDICSFRNRKTALALVAKEKQRCVGYTLCFYSPETLDCTIQEIFVTATERGRHIGTLLLNHVYNWARRNKCLDILTSVFTWNQNAKMFYLNELFEEDDSIALVKHL